MSETIDTLQDLIFALENSLRQPEWYIWEMPFWQVKKRVKQIIEDNKAQQESLNGKKSQSESNSRGGYKNKRKF